ncbi:hypothetical protein GE107_07845 [Cohnella sp. CFH 77786]|uniref:winged helix-turn-helix domain-containing protein n=1 Tax=Cohnella sp. CFH 77786 TaxID=2662265 RepID=UPI001C60C1E2|nr:response regulator transcription factor [Cohnella sp. CFH 77786]MBW5445971.1 hypothetical protein [Cohnella sp. CFH 77786]
MDSGKREKDRHFQGFSVYPALRKVTLDGREAELTAKEFDLLHGFVRHLGQVFSRNRLLNRVWDIDFEGETTVAVHVRRLREKIEPEPSDPVFIKTVSAEKTSESACLTVRIRERRKSA